MPMLNPPHPGENLREDVLAPLGLSVTETAKALGIARFDMKYSSGTLPHDKLMRSIELYGTKVMPLVREMLA